MSFRIKSQEFDEETAASTGILEIDRVTMELPNKFATTSEIRASKNIRLQEKTTGDMIVCGKLTIPESWKRLTTEDQYLKDLARSIARETPSDEKTKRLLFLVFRGGVNLEKSHDVRTLLDLQHFAGMDIITIQQTPQMPSQDFLSFYAFAKRWAEEKKLDKIVMPVLAARDNREGFEKSLTPLVKQEISCLGLDMRGGFHYHALRALEDIKKKNPSIWVHVFQVPPKIMFGAYKKCSEGMLLPYFGIDSFSRWVVPPPPQPLTKDVINMFDKTDWGVFKRKEWSKIRGKKLGCSCAVCKGIDLSGFFAGEVLTALSRSKVHDHLAQRAELRRSSQSIRERRYTKLLESKKYARPFVETVSKQSGDS